MFKVVVIIACLLTQGCTFAVLGALEAAGVDMSNTGPKSVTTCHQDGADTTCTTY